jgi:hypothetical protein
MKKLKLWIFIGIFIALCLSLTLSIGQQTITLTGNQQAISWDAVTQFEDGTPIGSGVLEYEVYIAPASDKTQLTFLGTTDLHTYTVTLPEPFILYYVAVRAMYTENGYPSYSAYNWSDQDGVYTPNPFGLVWLKTLKTPENFRSL